MATFTITTAQNIDELTSKTGGDLYNVNGGTLTIDQDSRVGQNQSTSSTLGNITLSASLGGIVNIRGTDIWLIPYSGGTGNVPAWNTVITQSGQTGTGKLIAVHSSLTAASTATGAAMPATGFIRIKQKSGTFAAGALTGIGATADNAGRIGWIEIVGDEASTVNANRLGTFNIIGDWYEVGTTNGSAGQTMQIPNNGLLRYVAGVFIETSVGSNNYEFYPNGGTTTTTGSTVATGNEAARGKVVWINNAGLVTIGNSGGTGLNGYVPVSGLKVVVGNVFFENCTTAARTANVIPNATLATRYDFTCTGGGVINIDKCNMAWYLSCSQAYSVQVTNSGFVDAVLLAEIATPMTWSKVGVGNKPTTALVAAPLSMSLCFAGGTFTDCVFMRTPTGANNSTSVILTDIYGFTFTRCETIYSATRAHTLPVSITATRANNCNFTDLTMIDGQLSFVTCANVNVTGFVYIGQIAGTTGTGNPCTAINFSTNCSNITVSGFSLPVTNTHPYTALFSIAAAGCTNIKIRNIGTFASPLNLGTANATGLIFSLGTGAAASNVKIQRVYCINTRTGIQTTDNSSTNITMENVFGDYNDAADVAVALNFYLKGLGGTQAYTAQTSVYGTHWVDNFTTGVSGRIGVLMNEPTSLTSGYITTSGGAAFTSAGGLYMPNSGQNATFETPYYVLGHTGFRDLPLIMAGGTGSAFRFAYQLDKGSGTYGSLISELTTTGLGTSLSNQGYIDPTVGFKMKLNVKANTGNGVPITSMYLSTFTSTDAQASGVYPLDVASLTFSPLKTGSEVRCYVGTTPESAIEIGGVESSSTSFSFTHSYGGQTGYAQIMALGYVPIELPIVYSSSDVSIPVQQAVDRVYSNS